MDNLSLFSLAVNQTIGVVILSIPYIYQKAGLLYSQILMAFCCYVTYYIGSLGIEVVFKNTGDLTEPLGKKRTPKNYNELVGPKLSFILTIFYLIFGFGVAIGTNSVFSCSFAANIPLPYLDSCDIYKSADCFTNYRIYLTIFTLSSLTLSILGLKKQETLQVIIVFIKVLIVSILLTVPIQRYITGEPAAEVNLVDFDYAVVSFTVLLSAVTYHYLIPNIAQVYPESILRIPSMVAITCFIVYSLVGIVVSLSFPSVHQQCNLSYGYLQGWFGQSISLLVTLLPAFTMITTAPVFPIMAAESIMSLYKIKADYARVGIIIGFVALTYSVSFYVYDLVSAIDMIGIVLLLINFIYIPVIHMVHKTDGPLEEYDSRAYRPFISIGLIGIMSVYCLYRLYSFIAGLLA